VLALCVLRADALVTGAAGQPPAVRTRRLSPALACRSRVARPVCDMGENSVEEAQKAADRAETVEYIKTLGGFASASIGLFIALTAGAGLEDEAAGNLVLVALCAYGAYLLFFDGGVTQAALENQAIRQLASEEGDIMAQAPTAEVVALDGAGGNIDAGTAALEADGFLRVNAAMSPETASALRSYVEEQLSEKRALADADLNAMTSNFGDVLMRENRYDLLLDLTPPVQKAADEVLISLKRPFACVLGEDAELFELAALVSDPRAPRQPAHPDTPFRAGEDAAVITAFVALQDVDEDMGPTSVIPRTHTEKAHERFNNKDDGGRERVALLRETPNHVGVLRAGDANLIDSRLIHCGGSNDSSKRRVLFYMSFRRRGKVTPSGSMLYKHRRAGYGLDNVDTWAKAPV